MKNGNPCPKCKSQDVVRIEGAVRAFGVGNNILVGATILSAVKVTRYLCCACGFIEEWIDSAQLVEKLKKRFGTPAE